MSLAARVKSFLGFGNGAQEGEWRGPFSGLGEYGTQFWIPSRGDGWSRALHVGSQDKVSTVYACVMLNARAVAQCSPKHKVMQDDGSYQVSRTSPAYRIFRAPNEYETFNQLILNTVAETLFEGESLWLAFRDERFAITDVHRVPAKSWSVQVDPDTQQIFYALSTADVTRQPEFAVPARDVCHFRLHSPRHPLIGESPIKSAALAIGLNVALNQSQLAFFSQMNRPSGVMSSDQMFTKEQVRQLREAFDEQSKSWKQGGVPILGGGLKFQPMAIAASDAQLIEQQKLSVQDIARVFGVPLTLLGGEQTGPQGGTEALISHWLSIGLGSVIESVERSLERLFGLTGGDAIELDTGPLLRADLESRINSLTRGIQGGMWTPNEARAREGFGPISGGDSAYLQQQMIPMDMLAELHNNQLTQPEPEPEEELDAEVVRALVENMIMKAERTA